jgi:hypothetical protein
MPAQSPSFLIAAIAEAQAVRASRIPSSWIDAVVSRTSVVLNSPGGEILAALKIGREIKKRGFYSNVGSNDMCVSACAMIWLAEPPTEGASSRCRLTRSQRR